MDKVKSCYNAKKIFLTKRSIERTKNPG